MPINPIINPGDSMWNAKKKKNHWSVIAIYHIFILFKSFIFVVNIIIFWTVKYLNCFHSPIQHPNNESQWKPVKGQRIIINGLMKYEIIIKSAAQKWILGKQFCAIFVKVFRSFVTRRCIDASMHCCWFFSSFSFFFIEFGRIGVIFTIWNEQKKKRKEIDHRVFFFFSLRFVFHSVPWLHCITASNCPKS